MKLIWFIVIAVLLINAVIVYIYEAWLKKQVFDLKKEITDLKNKASDEDWFNDNVCVDAQIIQIKNQAEHLRFCFLCPLYQDKVREGILQDSQSGKK